MRSTGKGIPRIQVLLGVVLTTLCWSSASAQNPCTRVGQEICQNGQVYRCEQVGSEIGPIFQNRPCTVSVPTLEGTWRGSGHQSPAGSGGADYPIVMTITNNGGSIDYPSLGCGGSLSRLSGGAGSAQYQEHITHGNDKCVDGGSISVNLVNGRLSWTWVGQQSGQRYTVIAVLERR
jgi:hypothetical protein